MFDYRDPGTDPDYCDGLSTEGHRYADPDCECPECVPDAQELNGPEFDCVVCNNIETDDTFWPYCSAACVAAAEGDGDD